VTSPLIDFGLRSYGTESKVWGGDPEHAHEWGVVPSPGSRTSDTKPGPMQHPGNMGREKLIGNVCACGAWRGELGVEPTPALFIEHLVAIFAEVKRVLRPDGLVFVNLGDSYANDAKSGAGRRAASMSRTLHGQTRHSGSQKRRRNIPRRTCS
jgi:hypothetical protein